MSRPDYRANGPSEQHDIDDEIDLFELLETLLARWKLIASAMIFGAALSFGSWMTLTPYQGSVTLFDKPTYSSTTDGSTTDGPTTDGPTTDGSTTDGSELGLLDYLSWREIQPKLRIKAQQAVNNGNALKSDLAIALAPLTSEKELHNTLVPTYAGNSKSLKALGDVKNINSGDILSLQITSSAKTKEALLTTQKIQATFVREVVLEHSYSKWLDDLSISVRRDEIRLPLTIAGNQLALKRIAEDIQTLSALRKASTNLDQIAPTQVLDPKGNNAKYLPVSVQLMALEADAQNFRRQIREAKERIHALTLRKQVIEKAASMTKSGVHEKVTQIDALLARLSQSVAAGNSIETLEVLNMRKAIVALANAEAYGLTIGNPSKPERSQELILIIALALLAAGFLAILWVLISAGWRKHQIDRAI